MGNFTINDTADLWGNYALGNTPEPPRLNRRARRAAKAKERRA